MPKADETTTDSLDEFLANIEEDGTHRCIVDSITSSTSKKDQRNWLILKYTVCDESSPIDGMDFQEFYEDFSGTTLADYNTMSSTDKRKVRDAKGRLRERLLSLGVPENYLAGYKDYDSLEGLDVEVTIETSIGSNGRKFTNVRAVALAGNSEL